MGDLTRIAANIRAMQSLNSLNDINKQIGLHQMRLATGKRITTVGQDPAGYQLAKGLEARGRGLNVALKNVNNAKNVLSVAEGGYQNIMDILQTIKEKATQASDYSLSATQRSALDSQVSALVTEIDDIVSTTKFNGNNLVDGTYSGSFHTGDGASDTLAVSLGDSDSAALTINSLSLTTVASAAAAITSVDSAITTLSNKLQVVGQYQSRLNSKEGTLGVAISNTESVRSSIEDADFAQEQMDVMKLQILQQTAFSSFTQANAAPQTVLSLFR